MLQGKKRILISTLIIIFCFFQFQVSAQNLPDIEEQSDSILSLVLPPLSEVLQAAVNYSPEIKIKELNKEDNLLDLKNLKKDWLGYFNFGIGYGYGLGAGNSWSESLLYPQIVALSMNMSHSVYASFGFSFPLTDLYERKSRRIKQQNKVKVANYELELEMNNYKQKITELYYKLQSDLFSLKSKSEMLQHTSTESQMVQSDFLQGKVSFSQLSAVKERYSKSVIEYQRLINEFEVSLLLLERITGLKIIK